MLPCLNFAVVLCVLQVLCITADIDTSSFLIFNEDHNKCVKVESATSITVAACEPHAKDQQFRWVSESRLLSLSLKLCLGTTAIKDWVKVQLMECDESNDLQHWQCKNDTLFGLKDQDLHLNWGNRNEKSVMIYKGSGMWSRWRIYGTQGDLCSKGYQEIFTLRGNAFGAACQFPFKFHEKWYAECTKDGRTDGQLWCATERDYDKVGKWGFCPARASSYWITDPVTGVQYQLNAQSVLTWYQARKSCQQQGADLLSIVELHEQSYISGLANDLGSSLWIGLNSLDFDSGWQWSNGNPFRYLNWAPGHPSSNSGLNCATLNAAKASKWESSVCSKKLGYICRKGNTTSLPSPSTKQPGFCPNHWVHYAGNCYYLVRTAEMWSNALAACRKEGGDLASIHNIEEQSFIISQSGYMPTDVLWIGMNDQKNQMLFEWSDHSHVTFTQWQSDEPSHFTSFREDCVLIQGKDGKWADHTCEKSHGYMCKKKASAKPIGGSLAEVNKGCTLGSIRFGSYCYNIGAEKKTFEEAKQACSGAGANLVDVSDRYENAFLVSLVGLRPEKYFWTGLSNTEDRTMFKWTTERAVTFTNFNVGMPDRKQGCVAMTTGVFAGLWDVVSCSNKEKYICKKRAEGVQTTTAPPTTLAATCASEWTPVGKGNKCLKAYKKRQEEKKTWSEARDFCRAIGGDLISFHSQQEWRPLNFLYYSEKFWIGLSLQGTNGGFVWSDGSPLDFEYWNYGEPNNHNDNEHCTEMDSNLRMRWNDRHCDAYNSWICQLSKGVTPNPEPVISVQEYNTTDDGWLLYNDSQYYVNMNKQSMEAARAYCKKNFGELVVITGESERKFLWKQISRGTQGQYYIGLIVNLDKSFSWLDGTPVTYTAWEHNEPNFANNDENCVTMYNSMGYWNDINCGIELPSICKRSNSFINTTMAPTTAPIGGCAPEWLAFQGKCYKFVVGINKNWHDARTHCINQGGNLLSITSEKEQAFLTTQMLNYREDFWIGMNDVNWDMRFVWTDGKSISYTNWAIGEPAPSTPGKYFHESYDCVIMIGTSARKTGYWKVADCQSEYGFICKRKIDSQIAVKPTTVSPKTFYKLGNDSYKVVTQKMRWDEARRQCQADDAELASILSPVAHAYATLQILKLNEPLWIGLNSNVTGFHFKWVDNWALSYTKWGKNEPKHNYACVYVDVDKTWKTAPCTNTYYSLCKRSPVVAPSAPPQLPGDCPQSTSRRTWIPFRGHCYSFFSSVTNDWAHASTECIKMGASLVSIQDPIESKFIEENVEILQDSAKTFWIGMYKTHEDKWMWIDNSPLDYTNWKSGMAESESCVYISSDTGLWSTTDCRRSFSYICKTPKDTNSFLIFNEDHNKCVKVESATSITVAACNPHAKDQEFRWVSESHLLSLSLRLCLGTTAIKDWVKVQLMECDENNDLQHWQCKNDTLFGLKDQDLHLNWGNYDEKSVMIYKGSGFWSRWKIYGTQGDLCSKGYQETFTLGGNAFGAACQFPFKFHEKWYAECTKDGRTDGQLWCATERDYDKVGKWGFCPARVVAPTAPPKLPADCPQSTSRGTWIPFRGHCYSFFSSVTKDWAHASIECIKMGASLVSIQDPIESKFIEENVEILQDSAKTFWIGMYKIHEDKWMWIDNSTLDYTNWKSGKSESCVYISSDTGLWSTTDCTRSFSYICKTPKAHVVQETTHRSAGITVAIVLIVIALVGLGAFLLFHKRIPRIPAPTLGEFTFDNKLYFNNPNRAALDTKGLVENIEQNEQA
uniref:Macrophage mannose receptor 1 n=2 Tax=Oreochromis niloticus TaxID=8128 RepID=A0A669CF10_ORENI